MVSHMETHAYCSIFRMAMLNDIIVPMLLMISPTAAATTLRLKFSDACNSSTAFLIPGFPFP